MLPAQLVGWTWISASSMPAVRPPAVGPKVDLWHPTGVTDSSTSAQSAQPDSIIGVSFDDVYRSQEFLTAVTRMNANGLLRLLDAVVVTKDAEGKTRIRETVDLQPGRAALSGAVWTGLLGLIIGGPVGWIAGLGVGAGAGAITAKVVDVGVPDEWVDWFREAVEPHTFTVVVLANDVMIDALVEEVARFDGGRLVYANLDPYAIRRIEMALGDEVSELPGAEEPPRSGAHEGPAEQWPPPRPAVDPE
jgi:uncharacterized membrane protein